MAEDQDAAATAKEVKAPAERAAEDAKPAENSAEVKAEMVAEGAAADSKATESVAEVKAKVAAQPTPTLRQIFELPEKDTDPSDDRWQAFQEKVGKEVKGIKWTATVPDLDRKS